MEFETKDWIIMLVPVVLECIVFFIFQTYLNMILKRFEKKIGIKDNVISTYLQNLMSIKLMYQCTFNNGKIVSETNIQLFLNMLNDLRDYYLANINDLSKFKDEYEDFHNSWMTFVDFWNKNNGKLIDNEFKNNIENQLKICEKNIDILISKIRNKGF